MKRFAIVLVIALVALVAATAIAGAFGGGEGSDTGAPASSQPSGPPVSGPAAQEAGAAALRATGGGTISGVTRDTTDGAAYAVGVKQPNGDIAVVRLDRNYRLIAIDSLQPSDSGGDGGD